MASMTDDSLLLSKHGAASKLGITPAALMKLVRADQVPYVELPGKGEIRFDEADLNLWINQHKGGVRMSVATMSEREMMQEHLRRRPEYIEERDRLVEDQRALKSQVEAGQITDRALIPVNRELERLRNLISNIDNKFRNKLIDSCENDELRDEYFELNERRKGVSREIRAEERMLSDVQYNLDHLQKELEKLEGYSPGDSLNCRSSERADYGYRIRKVKRDITSQTRFRDQHNKRIAELEEKRQDLEAEKQRVREQQIFE